MILAFDPLEVSFDLMSLLSMTMSLSVLVLEPSGWFCRLTLVLLMVLVLLTVLFWLGGVGGLALDIVCLLAFCNDDLMDFM